MRPRQEENVDRIMNENDGEEIIAIDKLNGVYRVQGEDMLADVTALI